MEIKTLLRNWVGWVGRTSADIHNAYRVGGTPPKARAGDEIPKNKMPPAILKERQFGGAVQREETERVEVRLRGLGAKI